MRVSFFGWGLLAAVLIASSACSRGEEVASGSESALSSADGGDDQAATYAIVVDQCSPYTDESGRELTLTKGSDDNGGTFLEVDPHQESLAPCPAGTDGCGVTHGDFRLVKTGAGFTLQLFHANADAAPFESYAVVKSVIHSASGVELTVASLKSATHDLEPEECGTD
jgi:hypothetical protein